MAGETPDQGEGRVVGGRYRLLRTLGAGGMGRVWLAHDDELACEVAMKEIALPDGPMDADEPAQRIARARSEARHAARLRGHPHVATVHDVVVHEGLPWIVMEYVPDAVDLQAVVRRSGPLPPAQVARIGLAVLDALTAGHRIGILHRDVKPANILLAPDASGDPYARVLLTDYGIALQPESREPRLTATAGILGTPGYLAPERARGEPPTPAADLFSLGATLYSAVEGRGPFDRHGEYATLTALLGEDPTPPVRAGELAPVLLGLLVKDPVRRFSPEAVKRGLERVTWGVAGAPGWGAGAGGAGADPPGGWGGRVTPGTPGTPQTPGVPTPGVPSTPGAPHTPVGGTGGSAMPGAGGSGAGVGGFGGGGPVDSVPGGGGSGPGGFADATPGGGGGEAGAGGFSAGGPPTPGAAGAGVPGPGPGAPGRVGPGTPGQAGSGASPYAAWPPPVPNGPEPGNPYAQSPGSPYQGGPYAGGGAQPSYGSESSQGSYGGGGPQTPQGAYGGGGAPSGPYASVPPPYGGGGGSAAFGGYGGPAGPNSPTVVGSPVGPGGRGGPGGSSGPGGLGGPGGPGGPGGSGGPMPSPPSAAKKRLAIVALVLGIVLVIAGGTWGILSLTGDDGGKKEAATKVSPGASTSSGTPAPTGPVLPYGDVVGLDTPLETGDCVQAVWSGTPFRSAPNLGVVDCADDYPDGQVVAVDTATDFADARAQGAKRCANLSRPVVDALPDAAGYAVVPTKEGFAAADSGTACLVLGRHAAIGGEVGRFRDQGTDLWVGQMSIGDCWIYQDTDDSYKSLLTECSKPHTDQVIGIAQAPAGMSFKKGTDNATKLCGNKFESTWAPGQERVVYGWIAGEDDWKKGFTKVVCTVSRTDNEKTTGRIPAPGAV
ncbi:protein kinase [Streptomyces sp. NPDC047072]|uniref:serine/threonine-protein kinase n=1 Tax=Streptomyces sp. NPDC047072 TaxID=3154809 RepID=UPI00340ED9B9